MVTPRRQIGGAPLRPFLGRWEGSSKGEPGFDRVSREYRLTLGDRFIEVRNRSVYPPSARQPAGTVKCRRDGSTSDSS